VADGIVLPVVTIYIGGPDGQYATNVDANSSYDVSRKGVAVSREIDEQKKSHNHLVSARNKLDQ
jgi:hypothetical protein